MTHQELVEAFSAKAAAVTADTTSTRIVEWRPFVRAQRNPSGTRRSEDVIRHPMAQPNRNPASPGLRAVPK